ncbi:MAG TPA: hypothetical protein VH593_12345, partial [Ktedonobacteraceae bacterium]
ILAGVVGLLFAVIAFLQIFLPTLGLLAQFASFAPLERLAIIIKLLSPLLSFGLAAAWTWVLLFLAEQALSLWDSKATANRHPPTPQERRPHAAFVQAHAQESTVSGTAPQTREKPLAVPPLFQLDPSWQSATLPVTPPPLTNPHWSPRAETQAQTAEAGEEGYAEQQSSLTQAAQIRQSGVVDLPSSPQQEADERQTSVESAEGALSLQEPEEETLPPLTMTLLRQVKVWVHTDDGTTLEVKVRGGENAIRLIQLAYIAWRQGKTVDRDKLLTYVLARGKRRDLNTDQLGEIFDSAKRYLRRDLGRAIKELEDQGHSLSQEVKFFGNEPGFYWLHPSCKVVDLARIDAYSHTIQLARKEGLLDEKLDGSLPEWVVQTCLKLIEAYPGDFLQSLLEKYPEEFGSWVREPVTIYRDRYLEALLILAYHESALGRHARDETLSEEQNAERRRHHSSRAAQLFYDYAMYALNSRWDQKLKFAYRAGKDGERVIRSERALRRCVVELGKLGNPDMIDQVYLAFKERMATLSEGNWKPGKDTESDVAEAKRTTTSAYRFSSQMPPHQRTKTEHE